MKRWLIVALAAALAVGGCSGTKPTATGEDGPLELRLAPALAIGTAERNPADPYFQAAPEGKLYLSWTEQPAGSQGRDGLVAALGADGKPAGEARRINDQPGELSGHGGENMARFTVGPDGAITATWMKPLSKTKSGALRSSYAAPGQPFAPAQTVNDDGREINHAFASLAAGPNGRVLAAWIDGRERTDMKDDRQTLYLAASENGGKTFGPNTRIAEAVCACCRTTTLFLDGGQTVLVSYRHVTKPDNVRNHVVVRSADGGKTFSAPVLISDDGWTTPGCPHAGVGLSADAKGRVHAVWWTGGRTAAEAGIYYTYSENGGQSFAPRQLLTSAPADMVLHAQVAADEQGNVYAVWENIKDEKTQIFLAMRRAGQTNWDPAVQVSETSGNAQFPAVVTHAGSVYVAWAEKVGEASKVMLRTGAMARGSNSTVNLGVTEKGSTKAGSQAPDFTLKDLNGQVVRLSDFRGRPVVLNFFASWCEPCRSEVPYIQQAHEEAALHGIVVLGVGVKDTRDALQRFMAEEKLSFPVVLDGDSSVTRAFRVIGPPATFFLDASGKVISSVLGPLDEEKLSSELAKLH